MRLLDERRDQAEDTAGATGPSAFVDRWGLLVVLAVAAASQAVLVSAEPQLGNGDYYLRNAVHIAQGDLPHSRYSPGFPLLLAPLVPVLSSQTALLGAVSVLTAVLAVVGLWLTHEVLRHWVGPRAALLALAPFAVGQAALAMLGHGEVESLALVLVALVLRAVQQDRWAVAALLTTLVLLVRLPLLPFFLALWVLAARRHLGSAALAASGAALAVIAQLMTAPLEEQDYVEIGRAAYGHGTAGPSAAGLLDGMGDRLWDYLSVGFGRFPLPARVLLEGPGGRLFGLAVTAVLAVGTFVLVRRWARQPVPAWAQLALWAQVAALTLWPIRAFETTRMLVPLAPVVLAALVTGVLSLVPSRRGVVALSAATTVLGLAASVSLVAQQLVADADTRGFVDAHEQARGTLPSGVVLSRKPGYTELALDRPAREYPVGATPATLNAYARRVGACAAVVDALDQGLSAGLADWVRDHTRAVVARSGGTSVHVLDRPDC